MTSPAGAKLAETMRQLQTRPREFSNTVRAKDFVSLIDAFDQAGAIFGRLRFTYSGVSLPAVGGQVFAAHILQLREALK